MLLVFICLESVVQRYDDGEDNDDGEDDDDLKNL